MNNEIISFTNSIPSSIKQQEAVQKREKPCPGGQCAGKSPPIKYHQVFAKAILLSPRRGDSQGIGNSNLEPVCKIRKEENGSDGNHGGEVGSSFFVARGNPTKLLEAIDEAFHDISFAIVRFVERTSATFGTATSNGATNVITMKVSSKRLTGIAFIGHQTLGAEAQLT